MDMQASDDQFTSTPDQPTYTFLLTNFDTKYQTPKLLLQLLKYVHRDTITEITCTRNGIIIKSPEKEFAKSLRNRHSFEIFGKHAHLAPLNEPRIKQRHN